MKHISSPKTSLKELSKVGEDRVNVVEMNTEKLIMPEMKSPDLALVNRILNYSKSLSVQETESMGKISNVMS